jgi:HPt (histidine-containing phosphotransfer) domain-containing protein
MASSIACSISRRETAGMVSAELSCPHEAFHARSPFCDGPPRALRRSFGCATQPAAVKAFNRHRLSVGRATPPDERTSLVKPEIECRLDPQVLAEVAGASPDFANELVDLFVQDSRKHLTTLAAALQVNDRTGLRTAAHGLKGSAGALGARRLSMMCHVLEHQAVTSDDREMAGRLVGDIERELTALVDVFADANLGTRRDARGAA